MMDPVFAVIGLWIVVMFMTFFVTCVIAILMNDKTAEFIEVFGIALTIVVVILELFLCSAYVHFKINPENYGYTRIEQEATEVSE